MGTGVFYIISFGNKYGNTIYEYKQCNRASMHFENEIVTHRKLSYGLGSLCPQLQQFIRANYKVKRKKYITK